MKNNIIKAVRPVAEELVRDGKLLDIKIDSTLFNLSETVSFSSMSGKKSLPIFGPDIIDLTSVEWSNEECTKISKIIGGEVSYIRNNIVPKIKDFISDIETKADKYLEVNPAADIEVVVIEDSYINEDSLLKYEISTYTGTEYLMFTPKAYYNGEMNAGVLKERLTKVLGKYNLSLSTLLNDITDKELVDTYNVYLYHVVKDKSELKTLSTSVSIKTCLILYLLTLSFKEDIPESVSITVNDYYRSINDLKSVFGRTLNYLLTRLTRMTGYGNLIVKSNLETTTIEVYGPAYREFLKTCTVEVLYGIFYMKDGQDYRVKNLETMQTDKEMLLTNWNRHLKLSTVYHSLQQDKNLRKIYSICLRELVAGLTEQELRVVGGKENSGNIITSIEKYIDAQPTDVLMDYSNVSETIICDFLYKDTNAGFFIRAIESYHTLDDSLSVQECAGLATIRMLAKFFACQVTVNPTSQYV